MTDKIAEAQEQISGEDVARMILDFYCDFKDVYGRDVYVSSLCAVGPLQAMIGLAIKNGRLSLPPSLNEEAKRIGE